MKPTAADMDKIRKYAVDLVLSRLPFCRSCSHAGATTHLKYYQEIVEATGWKWQPGATGTTCGFLCHWMLWQLGVTNKNILNWNDTGRGTKYIQGQHIAKIWNVGKAPFVNVVPPATNVLETSRQTSGPKPGDIIHIYKLDANHHYVTNSDHVFVFLSDCPYDAKFKDRKDMVKSSTPAGAAGSPLIWITGESGQGPKGAATDGLLKSRAVNLTGSAKSATSIEDANNRVISGWLDLAQLDYDPQVVAQIVKRAA
jgi:hypothetical protein